MADDNLDQARKSLAQYFQNGNKTTSEADEQQIMIAKICMKFLARPLLLEMGIQQSAAQQPVDWLDVACGTGVIVQEAQELIPRDVLEQSKFLATDSSQALVDLVKKRVDAEGWVNTTAEVHDAMNIDLPESSFSHLTVALGLHIIPRPDDVLKKCRPLLKPGGIFGVSTVANDPQYSMWQPDIRSAFASFPFDAPFPEKFPSQMHDQGQWYDHEWVASHLKEQGFVDVKSRIIRDEIYFADADMFLMVFGGMLGWIMNGWWSEELREAHSLEEVKELTKKHLIEKYNGKGWSIKWALIYSVGQVEK